MPVSVFVDNSNIWLVGREVCSSFEPGFEEGFRIHFAKLFEFAEDGRGIEFAYVGGSVPPGNDSLWERLKALGAKVETQERAASGGEVAVDEAIQLQMANCVLEHDEPGTMVLLTGDGSGYTDGKGFIKQLELAVKNGWNVEVVSWEKGCNRHLKEFAERHGTYRPLEDVYNQVTFINNTRWAG